MNEEKIPKEENTKETNPVEPVEVLETSKIRFAPIENESKNELKNRIENGEPTNEIPNKEVESSSAQVPTKTTDLKDDENLSEISSLHGSHFYNTDDEHADYENEFESEELWGKESLKAQHARLSLHNPSDTAATQLIAEAATLKVSTIPRLLPVDEVTSTERTFNQMFEDVSFDTLESTASFEPDENAGKQEDFFENLGPVPEFEDVRSDSLQSYDFQPRHYVKPTEPKIDGKFVDPLTGVSLEKLASDEDHEVLKDLSTIDEAVEEEHGSEWSEVEFEDFDLLFPEDEVADTKQITAKQAVDFVDFFAVVPPLVKRHSQEAIEEKDTEYYKATKTVKNFLEDLITYTVRFFDQKEGDECLRERLDKRKLFMEIDNAVKEFLLERSVQSFLQRKIETYYRRKRELRNITPDRPEMLAQEREKYKEAIENLNQVLGREVFINKKTTSKIAALFKECDEAEKMDKAEREKFNELVKKTFQRDNMPKLEAIIDKELEGIASLAEEISQVRAVFISRQHMLGALRAQLDELENIGNGLRVADYETIEREAIRLEKKIEEHNTNLERLFVNFRNTIHTMAHTRIRNEMYVNSRIHQMKQLSMLEEEKSKCRHYVFQLKQRRQSIQRQISDLSFQSGLLDKPAILLDYDYTVELVEKKRSEVKILRETLKNMEEKLKRAETSCSPA